MNEANKIIYFGARVMKSLPVFDGLRANNSWTFENEFTFSQISADWIHKAEGNKAVLSSLRSSTDLDSKFVIKDCYYHPILNEP